MGEATGLRFHMLDKEGRLFVKLRGWQLLWVVVVWIC